MIRAIIADDHAVMRKGLKHLFSLMGDVTMAASAKNGDELLDALQREHFDLLLLDLTMPGINGADLVERIHALYPDLPILIFSMRDDALVAKRLFQIGVAGFVTKGSGEEVLMSAIRKVAGGGNFIDPYIAEQMIRDKILMNESAVADQLSQRELQIMKLLAQGRSVNEIAGDLFISNRTVSTYKSRLMLKMNFKTSAELVLYASESGLI